MVKLPPRTFKGHTIETSDLLCFSMDKTVAALRYNSEPKCPRIFSPLGVKGCWHC
ncbi:MAG: hypothetical protein Q4C98_09155 [Capnocytophaga sp.]|nr:hypothetical protein [Capnocytophaga sp.]